ncbi:fasciclin domain-containing protein [Mycobacterium sp. CVI_P3]|uniref:Fasciclin domain-containing protein n=1 Tax=Mycobacterium pinniadriaticum TaxID=2994102 RepID=A0ABT3SC17_9MYCO|nr:fasciclin domain-containing protein [Mycobacterium pinniadriaticum]MCX2930647.1 fasciclin domain-containing protein [Mycobacterium pinniadriaticum]MCX2937071.1 fasciclin domain-containing protein [Mycobacterium pinniadriaticum]
MSTRTKSLGVVAALAAIAVAIPTAVQAYAEPTPTTTTPAAPTTSEIPVPSMSQLPDPQGSGCDAYKNRIPTGAGSFKSMGNQPASAAIAANPDLSTFSAAISGQLNPAVDIVSVLDGGPYVVFAPTNDAFAKLDEATLEQLKSDPALLTSTLFYHMVLGYLGPDDVAGTMPTQQGSLVTVTGKGGDIKINDTAKVVCSYTARGAYIYMIDTVLSPGDAPEPDVATTTTTTSSTESESPTTTPTSLPAEAPSTTSTTTTTQPA